MKASRRAHGLWLVSLLGTVGLLADARTPLLLNSPEPPPCPKMLMFDGLHLATQTDARGARYWGETVGVDGFFVNGVMSDWEDSVGDDEASPLFQQVKRFQHIYVQHGVTENFIKVALYKPHAWQDHVAAARVVSHFRQAAHLARFAGLRGLALDLEPYVEGFWEEDPAVPDKEQRAFDLGRHIGEAIVGEFPQVQVLVLPEVLVMLGPPYSERAHRAYRLAPSFWNGLIQARFDQLIVAVEKSYLDTRPEVVAWEIKELYWPNLRSNSVDPDRVSIALGLWPLGLTRTDKRAWMSSAEFEKRLRLAFLVKSPYVWIYGNGSAWQTDGPYGEGEVDPAFEEYVRVLHRVKESCTTPATSLLME